MNLEEMANELDRILKHLRGLDPSSKEYTEGMSNYRELEKAYHEELEACDLDLNNRQKRTLEKSEYELRVQDLKNRMRIAKMEAVAGIGKTVLTGLFTLGAIALTGSLEETAILSSKCLSWIKAIVPRT